MNIGDDRGSEEFPLDLHLNARERERLKKNMEKQAKKGDTSKFSEQKLKDIGEVEKENVQKPKKLETKGKKLEPETSKKAPKEGLIGKALKKAKALLPNPPNPSDISSVSSFEFEYGISDYPSISAPPRQELPQKAGIDHKLDENGLIQPDSVLKFDQISEQEALALQHKIEKVNPKYDKLSLAELQSKGQLPTHKIKIGEVTYYCSQPIFLQPREGEKVPHVVAIGLVEINGKIYPRLFYFSHSQAAWRMAPKIVKREEEFGYIHKGRVEHDTQLPIALNAALIDAVQKAKPQEAAPLTTDTSHPLIKTATHHFDLETSYTKRVKPTVDIVQFEQAGLFYGSPERINIIDPQFKPNFERGPIQTFHFTSPIYGEVTAKIFQSNNNSVQYLFYEEDSTGMAFLAGVEALKTPEKGNLIKNEINRYGVREKFAEYGDMDAPLREYPENMSGKNLEVQFWPHPRNTDPTGKYIYFWNYIRELPIIKQYYSEHLHKPLPGRV